MLPSIEALRALGYDPETGRIPSQRAGTDRGYAQVWIETRYYRVHRVAWAVMTGAWPEFHIDHINHDKLDNRWSNLRQATNIQNMQNSRVTCKSRSGVKGVHWCPDRKRWGAWICVNRKRIGLGRFKTIEEAREAYERAARLHFGEFACVGAAARAA